jgi:hypothetical protein
MSPHGRAGCAPPVAEHAQALRVRADNPNDARTWASLYPR